MQRKLCLRDLCLEVSFIASFNMFIVIVSDDVAKQGAKAPLLKHYLDDEQCPLRLEVTL
jgi:hypothetical protein